MDTFSGALGTDGQHRYLIVHGSEPNRRAADAVFGVTAYLRTSLDARAWSPVIGVLIGGFPLGWGSLQGEIVRGSLTAVPYGQWIRVTGRMEVCARECSPKGGCGPDREAVLEFREVSLLEDGDFCRNFTDGVLTRRFPVLEEWAAGSCR